MQYLHRAGFQMMMNALDPTFTLSSNFYYRSLLAKVFMIEDGSLYPIPILSDIREGEGHHSFVLFV